MIPTPDKIEDFSSEWVAFVLRDFFERNDKDPATVEILKVDAKVNEVQGILSTTYVVDVEYKYGDDDPETKSIFVKVPLKDDPTFASVNVRELIMFTDVLPRLQIYLDENCDGFFRLPMPERLYCHYDGKGIHDVFVFENLLEDGFENFKSSSLDQQHMNSVLECLSQLHGTGFAYKKSSGGKQKLLEEFPKLEVQIQLQDLVETPELRQHIRKLFRPFLHYLAEVEPALAGHAGYMKKMHKHFNKIIEVLEVSNCENLITFAHGDAKPNNFMFRNIEIDLEDLECEGLQGILIDWQGGFLGSVANDLMWALFPFLEAHPEEKTLSVTALEYYHEMLKTVLEGFHLTLSDLDLPEDFPSFFSLIRKSLILEFLIVTVIKPIVGLDNPSKLIRWHKETVRNETRRFKKKVEMPTVEEIFSSPRFPGFCHLYFRIATALGAFQEMGKIYFDVMKDDMFLQPNEKYDTYDSDVDEPDPDLFYRIINMKMPKIPNPKEVSRKTWICSASVAGSVLVAGLGYYAHQAYPDFLTSII